MSSVYIVRSVSLTPSSAHHSSNGGGSDVTTMLSWISGLPLNESGDEISTECDGTQVDDLNDRPRFSTKYCDTNLYNTIKK